MKRIYRIAAAVAVLFLVLAGIQGAVTWFLLTFGQYDGSTVLIGSAYVAAGFAGLLGIAAGVLIARIM
jgi:hypothetical protein